ncbi:F0F1 ATP synthase subunit A [uncultured Parolsenella sp.]|uniref:F0F1 ATP synthase subunit A n=1 Tax=uncultured Parolsenella sp. TaxID=2083008 RepID=UPI0027D96DE0|nr:F0F1 ATP synthase subunit A [uncultured Parolsenella sp.]
MDELVSQLPDMVNELIGEFVSHPVAGNLQTLGISQYTFWMFVAIVILCIVLHVFVKKQSASLVPQGHFVNGVEFVIDYVRDNVLKGTVGDTWKKHFPFIATVFFFVLINDLLGLIPGAKPGTGSIAVTAAVATCSFVYFIHIGVQKRGAWGYVKSLAPKGVPFPINLIAWVIEVFSTFLRLVTLAVRLFCNMFAGHVVMGTFAIMASLFFGQIAQGAAGLASMSIAWELILIIIYAVEMLVAVIQAYVFALLSSVYVQLAEQEE